MQIAVSHGSMDTSVALSRSETMQWFEAVARVVLIAVVVLIGAAVVRNVTTTLTAVTHVAALQQTGGR